MRELPLIACSLDQAGMTERGREFNELFANSLLDLDRRPGGATLRFRLEDEQAVRDLFAREKQCCPFWSFTFEPAPDALTVEIGAPKGAETLLDLLLGLASR